MEVTSASTQTKADPRAGGLPQEIAWFLSGAVLPLASLSYYRAATRRPVAIALLFLLLFTSSIAVLSTLELAVSMTSVLADIRTAYEDGTLPAIIIENGIARVDAAEPVVLLDEPQQGGRILVAIDTTGQIQEIDRGRFTQGFLLTRTELHMLNNGEYQAVPLRDLHTAFERDPIIINAETVSQAWAWITVTLVISALIFLIAWHFFVRLMFVAALGLLVWGLVSLMRPNAGFGPVIISGIYACVPAIYLSHVFGRSGASFPGLQTLLLIVFWGIGLAAGLGSDPFLSKERPARLWTALLGVPMLVVFILDLFLQFPEPAGAIALWTVTLLTIAVIAGLRLYFRFRGTLVNAPAEV